jgi:hypothetical protein
MAAGPVDSHFIGIDDESAIHLGATRPAVRQRDCSRVIMRGPRDVATVR